MKRREKLLRWSPLLVFVMYVLLTIAFKERGARATAGAEAGIRAEAGANCERICDRMVVCALQQFGDTPLNQARIPLLRGNCYSGCLRQEAKVASCFQEEMPCQALARCTVDFLYSRQ